MVRKFLYCVRKIFVFPIELYQFIISPSLSGSCIYKPSCSQYTKKAILRFGLAGGVLLGVTRIFRCNGSLFDGGRDVVPSRFNFRHIFSSYSKFWGWKRNKKE